MEAIGETIVKKIAVFALIVLAALTPAVHAQAPAGFTGKWVGTFTRPGSQGNPGNVEFNFIQKGNALTGTAGPADQQFPIVKGGTVVAGKAKFDVQQPGGPLFKFTLSIVKGRLTGDMAPTGADGAAQAHLTVDAAKAPAAAKKK